MYQGLTLTQLLSIRIALAKIQKDFDNSKKFYEKALRNLVVWRIIRIFAVVK